MTARRCILGFLMLSACGASLEQLQSRASFDMQCPVQNLQITEIDPLTRGVRGCGHQQQLRDWVRDALIWPAEGMPDLPEACATTP